MVFIKNKKIGLFLVLILLSLFLITHCGAIFRPQSQTQTQTQYSTQPGMSQQSNQELTYEQQQELLMQQEAQITQLADNPVQNYELYMGIPPQRATRTTASTEEGSSADLQANDVKIIYNYNCEGDCLPREEEEVEEPEQPEFSFSLSFGRNRRGGEVDTAATDQINNPLLQNPQIFATDIYAQQKEQQQAQVSSWTGLEIAGWTLFPIGCTLLVAVNPVNYISGSVGIPFYIAGPYLAFTKNIGWTMLATGGAFTLIGIGVMGGFEFEDESIAWATATLTGGILGIINGLIIGLTAEPNYTTAMILPQEDGAKFVMAHRF